MGALGAVDYKQPPQILHFVGAVFSERKWLEDGKDNSRNFPQGNRVYATDGLSSTLSSQGGGQGAKTGLYEDDGKVRKLMPIECERLMSWPDNWTKWGINENGETIEMSDSQRYKMCGNGVVSACVREIQQVLNF